MSLIAKEDEPLQRYLLSRPNTHDGWSLIMGIKAVMQFEMGWIPPPEATIAKLRSALSGLVGVDGAQELISMEAMIRLSDAPAKDKAVTIDAIHALLDTV
jgi:hypothetical protein